MQFKISHICLSILYSPLNHSNLNPILIKTFVAFIFPLCCFLISLVFLTHLSLYSKCQIKSLFSQNDVVLRVNVFVYKFATTFRDLWFLSVLWFTTKPLGTKGSFFTNFSSSFSVEFVIARLMVVNLTN